MLRYHPVGRESRKVLDAQNEQHVMTARGKSVILLVDDDADYCETLSILLSGEGYEVVCVVNGREALDWMTRSVPSLIILDLMMPIMGGREFLKQRKLDARLNSIPVIVTSGSGLAGNIDVAAVLSKPVEFTALMSAVRQTESREV
jgi:CheY-like chemotaxis protein